MSAHRNFESVDDVIKFLSLLNEGDVRIARSLSFETEQEASVAELINEGLVALSSQDSSDEAQSTVISPGKYEIHVVIKLTPRVDTPDIPDIPGGYKN